MELQVKLEVFDGPLDLLLHLIEKNKVDIFDIPIVLITEQYLDYVRKMDTKDMDVMSEFLVMAADACKNQIQDAFACRRRGTGRGRRSKTRTCGTALRI